MARYRSTWTSQRPRIRKPQEKWEILVGWNAPEDFDDTGIDAWVKRKSSKVKPTSKKAAARQEWEEYGCSIGSHCAAIPDEEAFVVDSLKESLKPLPKPVAPPPKAAGNKDSRLKHDQTDSEKKDGKNHEHIETSTLVRAKRLLTLSQNQKKMSRGIGNTIEDEEEADAEIKAIRFSNKVRDGPVLRKNELDIGVNHLITDKQTDGLSKFTPRDAILKQPSQKGSTTNRSDTNSIFSSRNSDKNDGLPTLAPGLHVPQSAPQVEPVKLCYTQSNISLILQKPMENLVRTWSKECLMDDIMTKGRGGEEDDIMSVAPPLDDLVSDAGSWSMESEPEDYPDELLSKSPILNERPKSGPWSRTSSSRYKARDSVTTEGEDEGDDGPIDFIEKLGRNRSNINTLKAKDRLLHERHENGISTMNRGLDDNNPGESISPEISKKASPVSLVLKTMVLDNLPNGQRIVCPNANKSAKSDKSKPKSAKSRSLSARTRQTPVNSPIPRVGQSLSNENDLPLLPHGNTFMFGLDSYSNPYKERLSSKFLPIGDLLPAVDTSLKSVLAARRPIQSGFEENRLRLPAATGQTGLLGDMSITGRDKLIPYEDNLILMREGVELLKLREGTPTGPPAFRTINNKTPLHRAQENTHKRLYSQLGLTNGTVLSSDDDVLVRLQSQAGRWQSSNGSLYSAPPRLGYVPGQQKEGEIKGSPGESTKCPPTSQSTSNSPLNSLYKLSRRRRTKERHLEPTRSSLPPAKLKPTLPKTRATPVGPHFRELTQLRT